MIQPLFCLKRLENQLQYFIGNESPAFAAIPEKKRDIFAQSGLVYAVLCFKTTVAERLNKH
jgi:hypothetical protein